MEEWKQHESGYWISNLGRIKGIRVDFLKPVKQENGYYAVTINRKASKIHTLVVETFIGKVPKGMCVNHIDGDKSNNKLANLEIVTPAENCQHAVRLGLTKPQKGEDNALSKLTEKQILEIFECIKQGESNTEIARKFNIYSGHVSSLRHGHRWKHLRQEGVILKSSANSKLPLAKKIEVIKKIQQGIQNIVLEQEYHLDRSVFSNVKHRKIWKDVWKLVESQQNENQN